MNDQVDPAASDVSEQTEPVSKATEQTTESIEPSLQDALLQVAREEGHQLGIEPPKAEDEPELPLEKPEETESEPETEPEEKTDDDKEEEKPEAKKGDVWPDSAKQRVAEETAKRKRANERADQAEARAAQYQAQLAQTVAPRPTEDNPFLDIQDPNALDRLERSYEKTIDLADENPDGAVDVFVGRDRDGKEIRRDFTPEELVVLRKKADKAIRKSIPERRSYLQQRAQADAMAAEFYPELKDPDSEFTKIAAVLAQSLLTGQSMKDPSLLIWIGHAVKGYQEAVKRNGNGAAQSVKSPEAKRIVESSRTKVAPTPTKTRSFIERGTSSAKLEKANEKFEARGDAESAEELVGALLSRNRGDSKRLEPIAE